MYEEWGFSGNILKYATAHFWKEWIFIDIYIFEMNILLHIKVALVFIQKWRTQFPILCLRTRFDFVKMSEKDQSSLKKQIMFNNNFLHYLSFPRSVISHLKIFQENYFAINFKDPILLWTQTLWLRRTLGPPGSGHQPEETHLPLVLPYLWRAPGTTTIVLRKSRVFLNYNEVLSIKTRLRFYAECNKQTLTSLSLLHLHRLYWKRHLGRQSDVWRSCENKGTFLEEEFPFGSQGSQRGSLAATKHHPSMPGMATTGQGQVSAGKNGLRYTGEGMEMQ